ncbi:2-amino-3-ketobutyrate coenzyme A ligase, mitochondrial-like [Halichondria panicea]|uniref:2-amino-3-ketobutyrate coenzyme A ligase, mitochondrial-like n=1 Tax=Halichondria panicea TaxID=6063 RepID=UPI00312B6D73
MAAILRSLSLAYRAPPVIHGSVRSTSTLARFRDILGGEVSAIREAGTFKHERVITTPQAALIKVQERDGYLLNFCANNYLGLSSHPEVIRAAQKALDDYGAGLSSVRFICGTQDLHLELESKIAQFHGRDDAILYASCFDANAGLFEAALGKEDALYSDQLNHASIIDGVRLAKCRKYRYKHRDVSELESQLQESSDARVKMIVSDGVFSMDGSIAPLKEMRVLADKYNALVFLDECHASGFLGNSGRGTEEQYGMSGSVDIINSTLGKALGGAAGGYTVGPLELTTLLRQRSRPYLFSNSLPPPVVAGAIKVFDLLMGGTGQELMNKLQENTTRFRQRMTEAGFTLKGEGHPITPVMLGDARLAAEFADDMLKQGIYVIGFSFPVVPQGQARIRVQISAVHSTEDVDRCVDAFISIGRDKGVIN